MRHRFDPWSEETTPHDYPRDTEVTVGERDELRRLYGPRGEVLRVFEDRPFRGYRGVR